MSVQSALTVSTVTLFLVLQSSQAETVEQVMPTCWHVSLSHTHTHTHTRHALLSVSHVQEDEIPEERKSTVGKPGRRKRGRVRGDGMENTA